MGNLPLVEVKFQLCFTVFNLTYGFITAVNMIRMGNTTLNTAQITGKQHHFPGLISANRDENERRGDFESPLSMIIDEWLNCVR